MFYLNLFCTFLLLPCQCYFRFYKGGPKKLDLCIKIVCLFLHILTADILTVWSLADASSLRKAITCAPSQRPALITILKNSDWAPQHAYLLIPLCFAVQPSAVPAHTLPFRKSSSEGASLLGKLALFLQSLWSVSHVIL